MRAAVAVITRREGRTSRKPIGLRDGAAVSCTSATANSMWVTPPKSIMPDRARCLADRCAELVSRNQLGTPDSLLAERRHVLGRFEWDGLSPTSCFR